MSQSVLSYRIFPLGDAAINIDFGNCINEGINKEVIARFHQLQEQPLPGMIEAIPAYSSITIYYDVFFLKKIIPASTSVFEWMRQQAEQRMQQQVQLQEDKGKRIRIPVCYDKEFATDIQHIDKTKNLTTDEIISLHTSKTYRVYMLGFLPGFAYMGEVDEKIAISRKPQPTNIIAGSVGIAGKQTGVYPLNSPGGWQIIGRTPLKLFDASKQAPALLTPGDNIEFYSITINDYYEIQNTSLYLWRGDEV